MPPICPGGLLPAYVILRGRIAVQEVLILGQDLDVPVRSMHADPLPIPDPPGGLLHSHDGRQAVLPCDHRAMGHQAPHSVTRPLIATNRGVQLGSV
jgi:hypothetical protein